ncbi:MAG: hypothetical protein ABIH28_00455 [archaeon]
MTKINQKIEVNKFKKLIREMYRGFPNWQFRKMVEEVIVTDEMRNALIDAKFLMKEEHVADGKKYDVYMLGPNALSLVSTWETEDLTKSIRKLTLAVIIMTGISLCLLILQTLNIFGVLG